MATISISNIVNILLLCWFSLIYIGISGSSPNIIYIILDDMGFSDMSARYGEFETPNLDNLYLNGIDISQHYVGLLCSPSRSQILTGRYAWNNGNCQMSPFGPATIHTLPAALPTLADLLTQFGNYETYSFGKWHLGYPTEYHLATQRGFNHFGGFHTTGIFYTNKTSSFKNGKTEYIDWWDDRSVDYDTQDTFSTFVTRNQIIDAINNSTMAKKPFFIYGAFQAPHPEMQWVNSTNISNCLIDDIVNPSRLMYCVNILAIDESMGDIVQTLQNTNTWDNTLIIFTTDNGGQLTRGGACNYPLRGEKGDYFDGGVRTLAFLTGGFIEEKERGTQRVGLMHGTDWVPTLLSIAGIDVNTVNSNLQDILYVPLAKTVAKTMKSSNYSEYLMPYSFDGIDLSQWLLTGDESANINTNVPLAIGTLTGGENDVAIVFVSEYTNHTYKWMNLALAHGKSNWCSFCPNVTSTGDEIHEWCQISGHYRYSTKLLYDLTTDFNETTNLMLNETSLSTKIYHEGRQIVLNYMDNVMFNDFMGSCQEATQDAADPAKLPTQAWDSWLTWKEYTQTFETSCAQMTNPVLMTFYTTKYQDYVNNYNS